MPKHKANKLSESQLQTLRALECAGGANCWLTAHSVYKTARDAGVDLSSSTIRRCLLLLRRQVEQKTIRKAKHFRLRASKATLEQASMSCSFFVKPPTPWSTKKHLRELFERELDGTPILIVDPYMSEDTLDLLWGVSGHIRLLTTYCGRKGKEGLFEREFLAFQKEKKGNTELRVTEEKSMLHGRYIICGDRMWLVDHSLQDLGKRPALVIELSEKRIVKEISSHFAKVFASAQPWPKQRG